MSAKKPSTTEGTPDKSSIAGFSHSFIVGEASCETYSAAASASGTLNSSATAVVLRLPMMSGIRLYLWMRPMGCQT